MGFSSQIFCWFGSRFLAEWLDEHSCISAVWRRRRSLRSGSVLSEVAAGWALPCPAFAIPATAFSWREAERFDIICPESVQEIAFLKSKRP